MGKVYLLLSAILVGVAVALTYYIFEGAVEVAIDFIWYRIFNTTENRLLIFPLGLAISFIYFWAVHHFDPLKEHVEEHGMGNMPPPTVINYLRVLGIGFLSLVAGASLGPEAILVPSCMIIGAYVGVKLFHSNDQASKLLAAAAFIALFAAFFHSFVVGLLSLYLVVKTANIKVTPFIFIITIISSAASAGTLYLINGHGLFPFPPTDWRINPIAIIGLVVLALLCFGAIHLMRAVHDSIENILQNYLSKRVWWQHALIASLGLSVVYLIGGPLIQFTGNASIQPLIAQSTILDWFALTGIVIAKIIAIAWSKSTGYRGGMIFPSLFIIAGLIVLVNQFITFNFVYGIIFGCVGMYLANRKTRILF